MEFSNIIKIVIAIVAVGVGIYLVVKGIVDRARAIRVQGVIVDSVLDRSNGVYYPLIKFEYEGQELSMQASEGKQKPSTEIGKEITVLYLPKQTKYVMVAGKIGDILVGVVMVAVGILFSLSAFLQ